MGRIADEIKSFDKSLRDEEVALQNHDVLASNLNLKGVAPKIREIEDSFYFWFWTGVNARINKISIDIDGDEVLPLTGCNLGHLSYAKINKGKLKSGFWHIHLEYTEKNMSKTKNYSSDVTQEQLEENSVLILNLSDSTFGTFSNDISERDKNGAWKLD